MQDRVFLDTNIILYAYSVDEPNKQSVAISLLEKYDSTILISTQVLNEVTNILLRKFKLTSDDVQNVLIELDNTFKVVNFDLSTQLKALDLKQKYHLQYYDALIIATALENRCTILYSEDMQHNQLIDGKLTIINPFISLLP